MHNINQQLIEQMQIVYDKTPLAVFLLGANGSGKSTLRNYLNPTEIQINIDPDVLNKLYQNRGDDALGFLLVASILISPIQ